MKVTAISPDADDPHETAPSPLSLVAPDLAILSAELYAVAGPTLADLDLFPGDDLAFRAEVQAAMSALLAPGGAR